MGVIRGLTRPLPVPGPLGVPGPYQVFPGTRLKTTQNLVHTMPFYSLSLYECYSGVNILAFNLIIIREKFSQK